MYTEKMLRDEMYEKVCQRYYIKMSLLMSVAKGEITLDEFEKTLREGSHVESQEELDKQVSTVMKEVKAILDNVIAEGGIGNNPVDVAKKLRKDSKRAEPSKEALDVILPYLRNHPDETEVLETFGWIMYDFIKSYENKPDRYKKALSFLNQNAHFCNERFLNQSTARNILLPQSCFSSFMRIIKDKPTIADFIFLDIMDFVEKRDLFLRISDDDFHKTSRYLYQSLLGKLNTENLLILLKTLGFDWISTDDYRVVQSSTSSAGNTNQICFAENILSNFTKTIIEQSSLQENKEVAELLIKAIEYHNKKSGNRFLYADLNLARLYIFVGRKDKAMINALRFISAHKKDPYAWQLLADCSEGDDKLAFLAAALLCDSPEEVKVKIQREVIPLLVEHQLYSSACFEVNTYEKTYESKRNEWRFPKELLDSWKEEKWYKENECENSREPLKVYAEKANGILISYLPTVRIFIDYINKDKGAVNFLFKDDRVKHGFFYMEACDKTDIKLHKVYLAKIERNRRKPDLYNVYELSEFTDNLEPFIREDHGNVHVAENGDFAFVSSDSMMDRDAYISAKLVEMYKLVDDLRINYEKVMSWDKRRDSAGWTVTKITMKDTL